MIDPSPKEALRILLAQRQMGSTEFRFCLEIVLRALQTPAAVPPSRTQLQALQQEIDEKDLEISDLQNQITLLEKLRPTRQTKTKKESS